jgi:phosphate transport system substrate-binding protein
MGRIGARKDYSANADDERIVASVAGDELALGYVGFGYFDRHRNSLRALPVDDLKDDVGRGPIEPTASNIGRGMYRPLARPLFIYVNADRLSRPEVRDFTRFYLRQAGTLAAAAGTIPLTGTSYDLTQQRLVKGVTGTMYTAPDAASLSVEYLLTQ